MTAEAFNFSEQPQSREWVVVEDEIDTIDVNLGRNGKLPLVMGYGERFGELGGVWRVVKLPLGPELKGKTAGKIAEAANMFPARIEVAADALEQEQRRLQEERIIYGEFTYADFDKGLLGIMHAVSIEPSGTRTR